MTTEAYIPLTPAPRSEAILAATRALLDAPDPAHLLAMRRANDMHRRRNIRWNVLEDHPTAVRDLTAHSWPMACQARWCLPVTVPGAAPREFVCTRRATHTGRHAAGAGGQIVAVWWRSQ